MNHNKRLFDLVGCCFAIMVSSPIMILISLLIKSTSSGKVLFCQKRVGQQKKVFSIYKFRSMIINADKLGSSVTTSNDTRITTIGKLLRKTKLDELPQLFNVLKGDMSLVGPRPDVPEIVRTYSPEMQRIFKIRPGITSLATLYFTHEETLLSTVPDPDAFYEEILVPLKINFDMEHVERNSFTFDLKILCQTLWILTFGRWWPIQEHPALSDLKQRIQKDLA